MVVASSLPHDALTSLSAKQLNWAASDHFVNFTTNKATPTSLQTSNEWWSPRSQSRLFRGSEECYPYVRFYRACFTTISPPCFLTDVCKSSSRSHRQPQRALEYIRRPMLCRWYRHKLTVTQIQNSSQRQLLPEGTDPRSGSTWQQLQRHRKRSDSRRNLSQVIRKVRIRTIMYWQHMWRLWWINWTRVTEILCR